MHWEAPVVQKLVSLSSRHVKDRHRKMVTKGRSPGPVKDTSGGSVHGIVCSGFRIQHPRAAGHRHERFRGFAVRGDAEVRGCHPRLLQHRPLHHPDLPDAAYVSK